MHDGLRACMAVAGAPKHAPHANWRRPFQERQTEYDRARARIFSMRPQATQQSRENSEPFSGGTGLSALLRACTACMGMPHAHAADYCL